MCAGLNISSSMLCASYGDCSSHHLHACTRESKQHPPATRVIDVGRSQPWSRRGQRRFSERTGRLYVWRTSVASGKIEELLANVAGRIKQSSTRYIQRTERFTVPCWRESKVQSTTCPYIYFRYEWTYIRDYDSIEDLKMYICTRRIELPVKSYLVAHTNNRCQIQSLHIHI